MRRWPILMRGPLVRATLAGTKDVTRRLDLRWLQAKPGDLLYVKETWAAGRGYDGLKPTEIKPTFAKIHYLADGDKPAWAGKTRVSLFMQPRFARLWLEVVSIREERLQEIAEEDAKREGVQGPDGKFWACGVDYPNARMAFRYLWESINGAKTGARWDDDPYVARIEFRRVEPPAATEV